MADTPGNDRPDDESESSAPRRRSNFVPPQDGAPGSVVDDDALAEALAAEVRAYTSPIQLPPRPGSASQTPPPPAPPPGPPAPPPVAEPGPLRPPAEPAPPLAEPAPPPAASVPPAAPSGAPWPPPEAPATGDRGSSTLEAIERLEEELRRRAAAQRAGTGPVGTTPAGTGPADAGPDVTGPARPAEPVAEPPGRVFQSPYQPFAPVPPPATPEPPPAPPAPPAQEFAVFAPPTGPATPLPPPPEGASPGTGETAASAPPPLVEPGPPASPPTGGLGAVDVSTLPPPVGLEPAPLPPYEPSADAAPAAMPEPVVAEPPPAEAPAETPAAEDDFSDLFGPPAGLAYDLDAAVEGDDDVVDEVDRVGTGGIRIGADGEADFVAPPSRPVPTVRVAEDELVLGNEVESHPAFLVETAGPEPTANDLRAGRAARLFWLWFATTSSAVSVGLGAVLFQLGMSLRQTIVAVLAGVAISFLPLGLGTLAGKWSGQPTMVVSRATFGIAGNVLPALLAIVSRVFWGGALLWLFATSVGSVLADAGLDAGLGPEAWSYVGLGGGVLIAGVIAVFGYGLLARVQLWLSILAGVLVAGLVVMTWPRVDLDTALTVGDGPWILVLTGAVLVFSFVGLAWVHSSADVARYQRTGSRGSSSMLWATFGATLPAFILIAWGAVLAASDPVLAEELSTRPLRTIAALLPLWYPAPLLAVAGIGLVSGAVLSIYSGGFAIQGLGVRMRRPVATVIAAVLVAGVGVASVLLVADAGLLLRDLATTLAVPVAAWAGIFAAETMIRSRGFHAPSLLVPGGIYPSVRWVNLVGFVVITAIGFGVTSAEVPWLAWQGYLFGILGIAPGDPLVASDVGVFAALVLGLLLPIVAGIPAIRRQERALDVS